MSDFAASSATHGPFTDVLARLHVTVRTNRLLLAVPVVLFALPNILQASAFRPLPALLVVLGTCASLAIIMGRQGSVHTILDAPLNAAAWALCLVAALGLMLLGGQVHLFYANPDWLIRDAVLADLVRNPQPVVYRIADESYFLRAPLGFYLLPALAGRIAGNIELAHAIMLAQSTILLGTMLRLLVILGSRFIATAMIFSGGLVIVAHIMRALTRYQQIGVWRFADHLDWWNPFFQYSSAITQFFWAPNHALPGWWTAIILLLVIRRELDVASLGVTIASLLVWSPLAILAALPLGAWLLWRDRAEMLTSQRLWAGIAAAAAFLPIVFFLLVRADSIPAANLFELDGFARIYVLFVVLQLASAFYLLLNRQHIAADMRMPLLLSVIVLAALPFFSFGPFNDLAMRGSLAALAILSFVFAQTLETFMNAGLRYCWGGLLIFALGTAPAISEIRRALSSPAFSISHCNLMDSVRALEETGTPANYLARASDAPSWLMAASHVEPLQIVARDCWPDHSVYGIDRNP